MTKALLLVCCGAMAAELETLAPVISLSLADGQLNEVTTDTTGVGLIMFVKQGKELKRLCHSKGKGVREATISE